MGNFTEYLLIKRRAQRFLMTPIRAFSISVILDRTFKAVYFSR